MGVSGFILCTETLIDYFVYPSFLYGADHLSIYVDLFCLEGRVGKVCASLGTADGCPLVI